MFQCLVSFCAIKIRKQQHLILTLFVETQIRIKVKKSFGNVHLDVDLERDLEKKCVH